MDRLGIVSFTTSCTTQRLEKRSWSCLGKSGVASEYGHENDQMEARLSDVNLAAFSFNNGTTAYLGSSRLGESTSAVSRRTIRR